MQIESPLSVAPLPAGLSNQKLALVGLVLAAIEARRAVVLPQVCDFSGAAGALGSVPIWSVFDQTAFLAAVERAGGSCSDLSANGCELLNGREVFLRGANHFANAEIWNGDAANDVGLDLLSNFRPTSELAVTVESLKHAAHRLGISCAVQLRIERDWVTYCANTLFKRHGWEEDLYIGFFGIFKKIHTTFGERFKAFYVTCDTESFLERPEFIRDTVRREFGYNIYFKADFMTSAHSRRYRTIDFAVLDFEMASYFPNFIGLSRSSFSNTCSLTKLAREGSPSSWRHYLYNALSREVRRRSDFGACASAAMAIAGIPGTGSENSSLSSEKKPPTAGVAERQPKDTLVQPDTSSELAPSSTTETDHWELMARFFSERGNTPADGWSAEFVDSNDRQTVVTAVADLLNNPQRKTDNRSYLAVLEEIHKQKAPSRYIEIGVNTGTSLKLAKGCELAIGIDPEPLVVDAGLLAEPFSIHRVTSDAFFRDAFAQRQSSSFDFAFIDGLHIFEFALRDFMGVEALSKTSSTICLHDVMIANSILETSRVRLTRSWVGDVWRLILVLRKFRPDLVIEVLPAYPTGLAVIDHLDPNNRVLVDNYDDAVAYGRSISASSGHMLV